MNASIINQAFMVPYDL